MSSFNRFGNTFEFCKPNCSERKPGCQGHCAHYKNRRAEYDRRKKAAKDNYMVDDYMKARSRRASDIAAKRQKSRKGYYGYTD